MNELEILKVEVATAGKANILFNRIEDNGLLNGPFSFLQFVIMKASVFWSAGVCPTLSNHDFPAFTIFVA